MEFGGGLLHFVLQRRLDAQVQRQLNRLAGARGGVQLGVQRLLGAGEAVTAGIREADQVLGLYAQG